MKKHYSLSLAALCVYSAMTANVATTGDYQRPEPQLKNATATESTVAAPARAAANTEGQAPASLVGKSYVTRYDDGKNKYNYFFTVAEGTDGGIVLENFAEGYNVNATYDAATGRITIPINTVIGTHPTYGDITLYSLTPDGTQYSRTEPITGTVAADGTITFDNGAYGTVSAGTLIFMHAITATEANAKITYSMTNSSSGQTVTFDNPLLITKTTETSLKIVGIGSILYGAYYEVNATINSSANTATIAQGTPVDQYYSQNTVYYLYGLNPIGLADDLTFSVITSDATSLLKSDAMLYCYPNGTQLSGYQFSDVKIDVNFNIFTGEATGDGGDDEDTDTPTIDGITYSLNRDNNTATVTGCIATLTDLNIPATITVAGNTYNVTAVAATSFQANKTITSVSIPASITKIDTDAFRNLSGLKTLYIQNLTAWCAIEFANGNANPIYNVFPTSTSRWGKVYVNGQQTTELTIPEGTTSIGRAFYGFKALTAVTLPSSLEILGDQSFSNCVNLTEVVIPENVQSAGSAFFGCSSLKKATLKGGVKTLKNTFYGCKALESVNLPEGVESIGSMTFSSCSALTTISLPSTVTELGMMAFDSCTGLTEIRSAATVPPTAGMYAFDGVETTIPVYVPAGSIDAYKGAAEWQNFTNYQSLPTSAIDTIGADNDTPAVYYNLQGVRVDNPTAGLYVVRQGNTTRKVVVK